MMEIFVLILVLGVVLYVIAPLYSKKEVVVAQSATNKNVYTDFLHQKSFVLQTINDLEFDYQTGKLTEQDRDELVKEQQETLATIETKMKKVSGIDLTNLEQQLEKEISDVKEKLKPKLQCSSCGFICHPGDKFCANCGMKL